MDKDYFRIVAIDPGTNTLGYSVIDVNIHDFRIVVQKAFTITAVDNFRNRKETFEQMNPRKARLSFLTDELKKLFQEDSPHCIIAESSFLKRNVSTFATLIECRIAIQEAIDEWGQNVDLELIDPMSVKYGIGAVEKTKPVKKGWRKKKKKEDTKILVRRKLESSIDLIWDKEVPYIDYLDEHSVDAVSIGYYKAIRIVDYLQQINTDYLGFKKSIKNIKG